MSVTWDKSTSIWFCLPTLRSMMKCTFLSTSPICKSTSCFRHRSVGDSTKRLRSLAHQPTCGLHPRANKVPHFFWVGILLILIAGVMAGDCMLPLKFSRKWRWENTWLVFCLVSLLVLPWFLALSLVHHLFQAYAGLTALQFATPLLFGAGWGIAQVLFGVSIQRLGVALAYPIVVGLGTLLGTLIPLFVQHRGQVDRAILIPVLAGIVVMLIGIGLSMWAGQI